MVLLRRRGGLIPRGLGLVLAIVLTAASLVSTKPLAACIEIDGFIHNYIYYSDGTFTHAVGAYSFSDCTQTWTKGWGKKSSWYTDEADPCARCF
jgi:hypothetical protein